MRGCKLPITALMLGIFVLFVSNLSAQEHFDPVDRTINSMSILIRSATLDEEDLVQFDEVGAFTADPLCVGANVVERPGAQMNVACWPDDDVWDEEKNGFYDDEDLFLRVWDHEADQEWDVLEEDIEVIEGDLVFVNQGWLVINIATLRREEPDIEVAPLDINFHNVWEDGEDDTGEATFEIRSVGVLPLEVEPIEVENEAFTTDFGDETVSIDPSEMIEVTVTFTPPEPGEYEGSLTINHNVEAKEAVVVSLWGELREPSARIRLSAESHDFGAVPVEGSSRNWQLYIYSSGEADLEVDNITVGDGQFSTSFEEAVTIEPEGRYLLEILFDPDEVGQIETDLEVSSNATNGEEGVCHLMGEGVAEGDAVIAFLDRDLDFDADPPQPQHFFGWVDIDDTDHWRMTILNTGGMDLWIYDIFTDNEAFVTDWNADSVRLRPDDHYNVDVAFTPDDETFFDSFIQIASSDPSVDSTTVVVLEGWGCDAEQWAGHHFRYFNTGIDHTIGVEEVTFHGNALEEGDEVAVFTPNGLCAGAAVVPAEGRIGIGAKADEASNDSLITGFNTGEAFAFKVWDADAGIEAWAEPEYIQGPEVFSAMVWTILNLSAEPPDPLPDIELSAGYYHFGQVDYDDYMTEDWTFTIFNRGEATLVVQSIDSDMGQFTTDFEGAEIESEHQYDVTVTFAPDAEEHFVGRLTIQSDDPVDPVLYVDVDGFGVTEVYEPDINLPAPGYFFGAQHINDGPWESGPYGWTLGIENASHGGVLAISEVVVEADNNAFHTTWQGREVEVEAEGVFDLGITFSPDEVRLYDARIIIRSNSPDEEEIQFLLRGNGSDDDDYFLHRPTETAHSISLDRAYLWMDSNENEEMDEEDWTADLVPGDEVAVFDGYLCVGHLILDGDNMAFEAFADLPATEYMDGFIADHEMTFHFWDWTAGEELMCDMPVFSEGNEAFAPNGESNLSVGAQIMSRERQIAYDIYPDNGDEEDPDHWEWGPIAVDESVDHIISIMNTGDQNLTITEIEVPDVLATDFGDEEVVLEPHASMELTVTFTPAGSQAYTTQIIIHSDDPDEPEFGIYMTGTGSEAEGYFEHYVSDINHSILIRRFTMGGAAPGIGDEIAVFVPEGFFPGVPAFCAGKRIVTDDDPDAQRSIAAWGNSVVRPIDWLQEGFNSGDRIYFKVWDASQGTLYENDEIEIDSIAGRLNWTANSQTVRNINVPGVFSLGYEPVPVPPVDEGDMVEFDLVLNNPPVEEMEFAIVDLGGAGGDLDENGHFAWQTEPGDAGDYYLVFSATDPNDEDVTDEVTVHIVIVDVEHNPRPISEEVIAQFFEWDDELGWVFHINEDNLDENGQEQQWIEVIPDLNEFWIDEDDEFMDFYPGPDDIVDGIIEHGVIDNQTYQIRVYLENQDNTNWNGIMDNPCQIIAADREENRDSYSRTLRMFSSSVAKDINERSLRSIGNSVLLSGPKRDDPIAFEYTVIVDAVNDLPIAEAEAGGEWRFNEGEEDSYGVSATDAEDAAEELTWTAIEIPEGSAFNDNGDGTGTFTWTPDFDDAGTYTAIFDVEDTEGGVTRLTLEQTIIVGDVNRNPALTGDPLPDVNLDEDCGRTQLNDNLWAVFEDLDNDEIRFTVTCEVQELGLEYADGAIFIAPTANWHGEGDIIVTARDYLNDQARGGMLEDTFHVTIASVNDAPGGFNLTTPASPSDFTDGMETVDFAWTESIQVPFEEPDSIVYVFVAKVRSMPDDSVMVGDLTATEYNDVNVREVLAGLGIEEVDFEIHETVEWYVFAHDIENAVTVASNASFIIEVNLAVKDDEASVIPEDYYLSPNFPNPFNARTTVKFGLPAPGDVNVTVWDMHGRHVANLAAGYHAAGRFEVVWDAGQIPTGVYVIRLSSADAQIMQKAILLK
ncbi:choice-of-anchor D domain-containing protein [bacterium]|nr:choice-of-anchor D domain-containing protein [bacterium]